MKCIKIILVLIFSIVHLSYGQNGTNGYLKQITTIQFYGKTSDATINYIRFDSHGNRIEELSKYVSSPIQIDTIRVSDKERRIEYTWEDKSISITQEFKTFEKQIRLGIDKNGKDTIYYSEFNFNDEGFPINGIIINHGFTSKYEISDHISMSEIIEIHSNIISDSEFVDFSGIIQFISRRKVIIAELEEPRNTIEIHINKNLKPNKVIKREWNEYHNMTFENKYSYKYKDDKLVEIKNVDMNGDLEMIRTIEYK